LDLRHAGRIQRRRKAGDDAPRAYRSTALFANQATHPVRWPGPRTRACRRVMSPIDRRAFEASRAPTRLYSIPDEVRPVAARDTRSFWASRKCFCRNAWAGCGPNRDAPGSHGSSVIVERMRHQIPGSCRAGGAGQSKRSSPRMTVSTRSMPPFCGTRRI